MALRPLAQRLLGSHARPEAFVDKTIPILGRLGYRILDVTAWREDDGPSAEPELVIVDERRQEELEEIAPGFEGIPRIVLTGRQGVEPDAPVVVAAIKRPAGLHDLYRVIQQVFEDTPRTTPRIPTRIPVQCDRRGDAFAGALISISENGGLLRCDAALPLGVCFDMSLTLPGAGALSLQAEAAYQLVPNVGVVFSGLAPGDRAAIGAFVSESLLG